MEAMDKGLDRLLQNENSHDFDRDWFEWEKEMERNSCKGNVLILLFVPYHLAGKHYLFLVLLDLQCLHARQKV